MKIQKCEYDINCGDMSSRGTKKSSPAFKSGIGDSVLSGLGSANKWIQGQGFLVSFLIQDTLGMTAPRTYTAFMRDKEVTGTYNVQEGKEVFLREGLTGPLMMAVAPVMFAIASKFGKSTGVNSRLIRRFGNNLKDIVKSGQCQNTPYILKDEKQFKQLFYKDNVTKMLNNTLGNKTLSEEELNKSTEYIMEQIKNYENVPDKATLKGLNLSAKKYKYSCLENIEKHIDNLKYSSSSDLNMLNKVKIGSEALGDIKPFATTEAIESMVKYSDDVLKAGKKCDKLDETFAENIKNTSIAKRFITNVATLAATLGVLSVLPKIYLKSDISPAERTAMKLREQEEKKRQAAEQENKKDDVAFKGKKPNTSFFSALGKFISGLQSKNEPLSKELEYSGHNFTNTLMAGLSMFGLLLPRGIRACKRAPVDENGKKDRSELYEILFRDSISSLSVVFAVPILTKLFVSSYEKKSGFVLMKNNSEHKSVGKKILALLNPYSSTDVLSNKKMESIYNVDSQAKMINFCEYMNKNKGDLSKILAKSDNADLLFKNTEISSDKIASLSKAEKNKKIIEYIKGLKKSEETDKLMKSLFTGKNGKNKILSHAVGLNSIPRMISMFIISPVLLGIIIPKITYSNTRKMQEKKIKEHTDKIV